MLLVALAPAIGGAVAAFVAGGLLGVLIAQRMQPPQDSEGSTAEGQPKPDKTPAPTPSAPSPEAMSRLQTLQQRILDAVDEAVIGVDARGRTEFSNPAATRMLGWSPRDLLGVALEHLVLDENAAKAVASVMETGENAILEASKAKCKDGTLDVALSITAMRERGRPVGAVLAMRDLSKLREKEARLRESEAHLRDAQAAAHIGSWSFDVATSKVYWSEELYRIFGIEPGTDIDYERYLATCHEEDRERLVATIQKSMETGQAYVIDHRIVRPRGSTRHLRSQGRVEMVDGKPVRMLGIAEDITKSIEAERELAAREEIFRQVVEASSDYVAILDGEGVLLYNNRFFEGYSPDDVLGKHVWDFAPPGAVEEWQEALLGAIRADDASSLTLEGVDEKEAPVTWQIEVRPFEENGKRRAAMIAHMR